MDIQMKQDGPWKRVKPEQARKALAAAGVKKGGLDELAADELITLVGIGSGLGFVGQRVFARS